MSGFFPFAFYLEPHVGTEEAVQVPYLEDVVAAVMPIDELRPPGMGIAPFVDVTSAMDERPANRGLSLKVVSATTTAHADAADDPFTGIEV